ncbi:MAG: hypothetical protein J7M11_06810 [Elusimicrobia bacterium]|nr:hypothetical protein [Elusimicrobiota bacterium]
MIKFGEEAKDSEVIITPIGILARHIAAKLEGVSHFGAKGWWKGWKGSCGGKKISVIHCGTGEKAADCILFLKEAGVKKIFFFGFAGSVNKSLPPGSFCSPALWAGGSSFEEFALSLRAGKLPRKSVRPFSGKRAKLPDGKKAKVKKAIYTLPSLFMERNLFEKLAEEGFDMVDMETAHAAFAAQGLDVRFLYYITDFKMEFVKTDLKKISEACLKSALS